MDKKHDSGAVQRACADLVASERTLMLSTCAVDGFPEISYAPFVCDDRGRYCIFVSALAAHAGNLLRDGRCSLMLIRPEGEAPNPFARERLTLKCRAVEIPRGGADWAAILARMEQRFGALIPTLKALPDFHLLALEPVSGTYVAGFGRAYALDPGSGTLTHIDADRLKARREGGNE